MCFLLVPQHQVAFCTCLLAVCKGWHPPPACAGCQPWGEGCVVKRAELWAAPGGRLAAPQIKCPAGRGPASLWSLPVICRTRCCVAVPHTAETRHHSLPSHLPTGEVAGQVGPSWHRAVPSWERDDVGPVKLLLPPSSMRPVLDFWPRAVLAPLPDPTPPRGPETRVRRSRRAEAPILPSC